MTVWSTATALGEFTVCLVLLPCHSHSQSFSKGRLNAERAFHSTTLQFGNGGVDGCPSYCPKVPHASSVEYN